MSVYCELIQKTCEGTLLSITSTNTLVNAGGTFLTDGIIVGSNLRLSGWSNSGNNTDVVVATVIAGTVTVEGTPLTIEAATQVSVSSVLLTTANNQLYKPGAMGVFTVGAKVDISGSTYNDGTYTVKEVTGSYLTLDESTLITQGVPGNVTQQNKIETVNYFSDKAGGVVRDNSKSVSKYYEDGSIIDVSDVSYVTQNRLSRIQDGAISIKRSMLENFKITNRVFKIIVKHSDDKASPTDFTLYNAEAIIQDISNHQVDFKIRTSQSKTKFLENAFDVQQAAGPQVYSQNRYFPENIGTLDHADPLLLLDYQKKFCAGASKIFSVYDDGVLIEFDGITTSQYPAISVAAKYGDYEYKTVAANPIKSPPAGTVSNNSAWIFNSKIPASSQFEANLNTVDPSVNTFTLLTTPAGEVTMDSEGKQNTFVSICGRLAGLMGHDFDSTYADTASSVQVNLGITTQTSVELLFEKIMEFHEHIAYLDQDTNTVNLIDRKTATGTASITRDRNSDFPIKIGGADLKLPALIFSYTAFWDNRVPILNPVELATVPTEESRFTGSDSGKDSRFEPIDKNVDRVADALDKKVDIANDYQPFTVTLTEGLDPDVEVGVLMNFDDGWVSGKLLIESFEYRIKEAETICHGIAHDVTYT